MDLFAQIARRLPCAAAMTPSPPAAETAAASCARATKAMPAWQIGIADAEALAERRVQGATRRAGHARSPRGTGLVPKVGVEPTHPYGYTILSRARLPVSPLRRAPMIRQPALVYCGALPDRVAKTAFPFRRRCPMADRAGAVMFKGNPITLGGPEIKAGGDAPDFTAVDNGLQPVKLSQAKGKVIVLSAVPSLDTPGLRHRDAPVQPGSGQARRQRRGVDGEHGPALRPEALVRRRGRHRGEDPVRLPRARRSPRTTACS